MKRTTLTALACMATFTLALAWLITGCTSPPQLHRHASTNYWWETKWTNNPIDTPDYAFSVIEFDDQGELWDRRQLNETLNIIKTNSATQPITLVVFVHGWKHDASEASSNLVDFRRFVTNLSVWTNAQAESQFRKVIGVYIAWRGDIMGFKKQPPGWLAWVPRQLSFYDRKSTAAQVAGISATESILSLAALTRVGDARRNSGRRSRVIIIGHSFGGLIVERAVTQAMLGNMLANAAYADAFDQLEKRGMNDSSENWRSGLNSLRNAMQRPPADLVLLVNPASEALVAKKMVEALKFNPVLSNAPPVQAARPWIISVTSKGDSATRRWFPLGRNARSLTQRFRCYCTEPTNGWYVTTQWGSNAPGKTYTFSQRSEELRDNGQYQRTFYSRTAGNEKSLRSHRIETSSNANPLTGLKIPRHELMLALMSTNLNAEGWVNSSNEFAAWNGKNGFQTYVVKDHSKSNRQNSAYWIMDAPVKLIADHNSIFTANFYGLAAALTRMSAVFETNAVPQLKPDAPEQRGLSLN